MDRRRFLAILAGTAAASTTSYFLPPIGGWASDIIAHPDMVLQGPRRMYFYRYVPGTDEYVCLTSSFHHELLPATHWRDVRERVASGLFLSE